ncbi:hypothetical protein OROMI_008740 [Orobanche minor]
MEWSPTMEWFKNLESLHLSDDKFIHATPTWSSTEITDWIDEVLEDENPKRFIGFDIQFGEENGNPRIGTVQFYYNYKCLMIQFCHIQPKLISDSIYKLLSDKKNTFVGKTILEKLVKFMLELPVGALTLFEDYSNLARVPPSPQFADVRILASTLFSEPLLTGNEISLELLALMVLEGDEKDESVATLHQHAHVQYSDWCT